MFGIALAIVGAGAIGYALGWYSTKSGIASAYLAGVSQSKPKEGDAASESGDDEVSPNPGDPNREIITPAAQPTANALRSATFKPAPWFVSKEISNPTAPPDEPPSAPIVE